MARDTTARLFAAVDPPAEVAGELSRWARSAARGGGGEAPALRVLDAASLHVTLLFLGERPHGEIAALSAALAEAAERSRCCEIETGAPLWLPPRRPRALSVEIHDPSGELAGLQAEVVRALCSVTDRPPVKPPRRFRAHVTVARSRALPRKPVTLAATPQLRFDVREAVLYRSRLDPGGARYEQLASAPLGGWRA